jgi:hypothetical protein
MRFHTLAIGCPAIATFPVAHPGQDTIFRSPWDNGISHLKHPTVGRNWSRPRGQRSIAGYKINGEQLFYSPTSCKKSLILSNAIEKMHYFYDEARKVSRVCRSPPQPGEGSGESVERSVCAISD